jgi:hypothetical protein
MGAAMATVAALDLRYSLEPRPDIRLYTFGSPRVGNDIFADFFKTAIQARHFHHCDIPALQGGQPCSLKTLSILGDCGFDLGACDCV